MVKTAMKMIEKVCRVMGTWLQVLKLMYYWYFITNNIHRVVIILLHSQFFVETETNSRCRLGYALISLIVGVNLIARI